MNALTRLASGTVGVVCGPTGPTISGIQVTLPPNGGTIYIEVAGGTPSSPVMGNFTLRWGPGG